MELLGDNWRIVVMSIFFLALVYGPKWPYWIYICLENSWYVFMSIGL